FYLPELAAVGTYLGNVSVSYRSPAFALLVKLAYTGMAVTVSSGIATGRFGILKGLIFSIPILLWGIYSSNKDPLLVALLGLAVYFLPKLRRMSSVVLICVGALLLASVGTAYFSQFRAGLPLSFSRHMEE